MNRDWGPLADQHTVELRAKLLQQIRVFMEVHDILEVDTPVLSRAGTTDPAIQSLVTSISIQNERQPRYLGTSPELFMKRLLASGSGPIYQVCKVFRDDEKGHWHQPEFSMLEWYVPGFTHMELIGQVGELLMHTGLGRPASRDYASVFSNNLNVDPHTASIEELSRLAGEHGLQGTASTRSQLLEFLFSHAIAPGLGHDCPVFIHSYPRCQAALAKISAEDPPCAERFELFIQGMEIANGFHELTDAVEQRRRFEAENSFRLESGSEQVLIDEHFLSALAAGLPDCAGVAVGLDRLLMIIAGKDRIEDVMTFPVLDA